MSLQDLILMLQQAGILVDQLMASVAPAVAGAGMQLCRVLALIVVVWTGAQMALSGGGVNMAAVVRMVIGLSDPARDAPVLHGSVAGRRPQRPGPDHGDGASGSRR